MSPGGGESGLTLKDEFTGGKKGYPLKVENTLNEKINYSIPNMHGVIMYIITVKKYSYIHKIQKH